MSEHDYEDIDIEGTLRGARPEPTDEFVAMVASRVRADQPRRRIAPRMALAFSMTLVALAFAAVFGGISQAAYSVEGAVSAIVHVGQKAKPHHASTASGAAASSPSTGAASGTHSQFGGGASHGGSHPPPPRVKPSGSPSDDQYNPGCSAHYRGVYIICRAP